MSAGLRYALPFFSSTQDAQNLYQSSSKCGIEYVVSYVGSILLQLATSKPKFAFLHTLLGFSESMVGLGSGGAEGLRQTKPSSRSRLLVLIGGLRASVTLRSLNTWTLKAVLMLSSASSTKLLLARCLGRQRKFLNCNPCAGSLGDEAGSKLSGQETPIAVTIDQIPVCT